MSHGDAQPNVFCTVVTLSHIKSAYALWNSISECNQTAHLYVLVVDILSSDLDGEARDEFPFQVVAVDELHDQDTVMQMGFYYTPFELCNALKAWLHRYLFERTSHQKWIYLDSDIFVTNSFDPVWSLLDRATILLTPHRLSPFDLIDEKRLLDLGAYNGGFLAMRKCLETSCFVDWFCERLRLACFSHWNGLFVDQKWLDLVPSLFHSSQILFNPGLNVAYWNLDERPIELSNGIFSVNGEKLLFFHFSGWSLTNPEVVSRYHQRTFASYGDGCDTIRKRYLACVNSASAKCVLSNVDIKTYSNGAAISQSDRRAYFFASEEEKCKIGCPRENRLLVINLKMRLRFASFIGKVRHRLFGNGLS